MRMSARVRWSAFWICSLFLGGSAIDAGCGSDSFTGGMSTDAGSDTDTGAGGNDGSIITSDAEADTGPGACISPPPTPPPNEVAFCNVFAAISSRCNACADCQKENAGSCATFGDHLSDAIKAGIVACADEIDCADFENQAALTQDPCVSAYVFDAGPTSAQKTAKDAYCTRCADAGNGGDNCTNYFGSPDGGGIGSVVLFSSDTVAASVTTDCTACDVVFYPLCSAGKFCTNLPKDQCGKGVCK